MGILREGEAQSPQNHLCPDCDPDILTARPASPRSGWKEWGPQLGWRRPTGMFRMRDSPTESSRVGLCPSKKPSWGPRLSVREAAGDQSSQTRPGGLVTSGVAHREQGAAKEERSTVASDPPARDPAPAGHLAMETDAAGTSTGASSRA